MIVPVLLFQSPLDYRKKEYCDLAITSGRLPESALLVARDGIECRLRKSTSSTPSRMRFCRSWPGWNRRHYRAVPRPFIHRLPEPGVPVLPLNRLHHIDCAFFHPATHPLPPSSHLATVSGIAIDRDDCRDSQGIFRQVIQQIVDPLFQCFQMFVFDGGIHWFAGLDGRSGHSALSMREWSRPRQHR